MLYFAYVGFPLVLLWLAAPALVFSWVTGKPLSDAMLWWSLPWDVAIAFVLSAIRRGHRGEPLSASGIVGLSLSIVFMWIFSLVAFGSTVGVVLIVAQAAVTLWLNEMKTKARGR